MASRPCRDAVCYVNGNLIVALDRRDSDAIKFVESNQGCLYTVAQIMDRDVIGARGIARRYGIQYRWVSKTVYERIEAEAWKLIVKLERDGWTLNDRQRRDARHIVAAVETGARFFVTEERVLCEWLSKYYSGRLSCLRWRGGSCAQGEHRGDPENQGRARKENGGGKARQGGNRSPQSGSHPRTGSKNNRKVVPKRDRTRGSHKNAKGSGKACRRKRAKSKVKPRRSRKPRRSKKRRGG